MRQQCAAEDLTKWLETALDRLSVYRDSKVIVIGLIGKESQAVGDAKTDHINALLNRQVFLSAWARPTDAKCMIEAYFDPENECVFLHLVGVHDLNSSTTAFADTAETGYGFFATLAKLELEHSKLVLFTFLVCHAIVFVEPACRFDLSYARLLRNLNHMRQQTASDISSALSKATSVSKEWAREGRLCSPRMLFAFHRNPLRADLGAVKRKELVDKLERSMEDQIYEILRKSRIITNNCALSIGAIPPNTPFVHIFTPSEAPRDPLKELLEVLHDIGEPKGPDDDKRKKKRIDEGFSTFLLAHLEEARKSGFDDNVGKTAPVPAFELPRLKAFIRGASAVYRVIMEDKSVASELPQLLNVEMEFSEARSRKTVPAALRNYEQDLPQYYPRRHHEMKLAQALQYLTSQSCGPKLQDAIVRLTDSCEAFWKDGRQACEGLSLTGNHCSNQIHSVPGEENANADLPSFPHSSKARYLSTCNCGYKQELRNDPFELKEANFDYYERSEFHCCQSMNKYEFPTFHPESISSETAPVQRLESEHNSQSREDNQKGLFRQLDLQTQSQDEQSGVNSAGDVDMLLDRDNKLAIASDLQLEGHESLRKRHGSSSADSTKNRQATQEEDDVHEGGSGTGSVVSDLLQDEAYLESHNDSSDLDTSTTLVAPDVTLRRRLRKHSRQEDEGSDHSGGSDGEENEGAGEMLSEATPVSKPVTAYERSPWQITDEALVNIKEKYKGLYLEGMPHSQSPSGLDPLYPSWAVVCVGSSSIYTHATGLRDMPNFSHGSQYLLPWDVTLKVDVNEWDRKMDLIGQSAINQNRPRRPRKPGDNTEKVKVFVGFEYECPRGHRFMLETPDKMLKHNGAGGPKESATTLIRSDMPLWFPCSCRSNPRVNGQLMRLHIVTPKAPVAVTLNPRVQPSAQSHLYFHPGTKGLIQLTWGKYYIMRFPYSYVGPDGPIYPPQEQMTAGRLLKGVLGVIETDL
uniref:Nonsense-mediated mRNA decay factor SMG8 n=1 Tax=Plectus sambesii TaxID=2011161 RepID=A0A914WIP1_9BILA